MFTALLCLSTITTAENYPRAHLLVEADALTKRDAKAIRILDARSEAAYRNGHIPGAVWVDHAKWSKAFADSRDADHWGKRLGDLGIGLDTPVVIYDDSNARDAARIWWILRYWGVTDVRLVNGGWKAWHTIGGATESEIPTFEKRTPKLVANENRFANKETVLNAVKNKNSQIIDARSKAEHCGTRQTAKRSGAIPGALHRDWTDLVDEKSGRFKSADELAELFKASGIDLTRPTMTYCQSGGRSSVMAFALELMAANGVQNYYRGWAEWGNAEDMPVQVPDKK